MTKYIIILLLGFSTQLFAQQDLLRLKNGSEIRGVVTEQVEGGVEIKTRDGSIFNFSKIEIENISKYKTAVKNKGIYNSTTISFLGGTELSPSFQIVNGYSFSPYISAGVGIGVETLQGIRYFPLFLEGRYTILNKRSTPFCAINFGLDLPTVYNEYTKGGFLGAAQVGYIHQFGDHISLMTSIGYRYANLKTKEWAWFSNSLEKKTIEINRYEFRFGFIFR